LFPISTLRQREDTLLAPSKFARFLLAISALAVLCLAYDIVFLRNSFLRLLVSNSLDFVVAALSFIAAVHVARRSSGYIRQVWMLLSIALGLAALGQALSTYYESFVPGSLTSPVPPDILFFVWVAPILMIFLPRSEEENSGIDYIRLLDFLQVAIVAVVLYLYFFYSSPRWRADQTSMVSSILAVYLVRDFLICAAFFFRSRTTVPPWFRRFCITLAVCFFFAALSDAEFMLTIQSATGDATWGDLLWMAPFFTLMFLALTWKQPESPQFTSPPSPLSQLVTARFLPIAMPLLVIFLARAIMAEHIQIAWLAVSASVLCSSARLVLTNRRQRLVSDNLLNAQKALVRSERLFSAAFRSSPDSFSINVFPHGPYIDVNDSFTRITGYSREEAINVSPVELNLWVGPSTREQVLLQLAQQGEINEVEFAFRTKSGQLRTGQLSGALIELDGKQCALVVVRDITQRKAAEDLLRTSEQRFRSLVDLLHVGIVTCDPQGTIIFANKAALEMFGFSSEEVLDRHVYEIGLVGVDEDGHPIPEADRPVLKVLATRQPLRNQVIGLRHARHGGFVWTLFDVIPELDSSGEIVRLLISLTNLTTQRVALEALRESEERFRTLVRDLQAAVVLHGPDRRIQFANQAALDMFNFTPDQAIGKHVRDLAILPVDESGNPISLDLLPVPTVIRTRRAIRNRIFGWVRPGIADILWISSNVVPQFAPDGSLVRVIASFVDISEMKNAERAIHQLSTDLLKLQDEERRRIGRELHDGMAQTVLAINLNLAQVRQATTLPESATRPLDRARELLSQMSREIRTLSYLLHPPLLDDLGLVSALKEYVTGFSERTGIDATFESSPNFRRLPQAVETALFRITQESLANAQRHSGSSHAKIFLQEDSTAVSLEISDFGCGMVVPENGASHHTRSPLGVGIPGMRERMAQLGGSLALESSSAGTTIRATILLTAPILKETLNDAPAYPHRG
jgi:PAS domain S-box-containing protein